MSKSVFRLCYIEGNQAFFTTQDIEKQWGDDWNDVPYEHNAEEPYRWREGSNEPPWEIKSLFFDVRPGWLKRPHEGYFSSPYSVQSINAKAVPWLMGEGIVVWAGTEYEEFKRLILEVKGRIWEETETTPCPSTS
jgi:hypothetical protein